MHTYACISDRIARARYASRKDYYVHSLAPYPSSPSSTAQLSPTSTNRIVESFQFFFFFFSFFNPPFDSSYSKLFSPFFPRFFPTKIEPRPFRNICDERKRIKIKAFEELSIRLKRINRGYVEKWRDSMVIAKGKIYL